MIFQNYLADRFKKLESFVRVISPSTRVCSVYSTYIATQKVGVKFVASPVREPHEWRLRLATNFTYTHFLGCLWYI